MLNNIKMKSKCVNFIKCCKCKETIILTLSNSGANAPVFKKKLNK